MAQAGTTNCHGNAVARVARRPAHVGREISVSTFRMLSMIAVLLFAALPVRVADIPKQQLAAMFAQIARETSWDLGKPLLWGYFFLNPERGPLERAIPLLRQKGYRIVGVSLADKRSPLDPDTWRLHVEREEVHTVDSLHRRNDELNRFAAEHGIASYDGMDVGPIGARP